MSVGSLHMLLAHAGEFSIKPSQVYLSGGTLTLRVPLGVTTLSAVVIGGGGGGGGGAVMPTNADYYGQGGSGGGGGGLSYGTFVVTPEELLTIIVGAGGFGGGTSGTGTYGGYSYIRRGATNLLTAIGGVPGQGGTGSSGDSVKPGGAGGAGIQGTEADGGGNGGTGGDSTSGHGTGGGGAGGYSGNGGAGGGGGTGDGSNGTGGGGGGGAQGGQGNSTPYTASKWIGHRGGSTKILGEGSSGAGGDFDVQYAYGGDGSTNIAPDITNYDGGGGGAGGNGAGKDGNGYQFMALSNGVSGWSGAARLIWGDGTSVREYPTTNTEDV
jgi:hypothetical protein